jgi:hypothetical protein
MNANGRNGMTMDEATDWWMRGAPGVRRDAKVRK